MDHFIVASALASFATLIGIIPALFLRNITHRWKDVLLAYSAGIMVAASTYGLIPSALKLSNLYVLTFGILFGTFILTMAQKLMPETEEHGPSTKSRSASPFILALVLHNIPEGVSTGVSLASQDADLGAIVTFAIGIQNIPEGFLCALFLITLGEKIRKAVIYTVIIAFMEWISSLLGYAFGLQLKLLIPYGLAFAAGAMLYIVYKELIPESHGDGHEIPATFAFIIGTITMIVLTHLLGA